jgi:hypothetical protein
MTASKAIRSQGTYLQRGTSSAVTPQTIASITATGTTATLTTSSAHGLNTGDTITVSGATPAAYNGTFTFTKLTSTTGTYTTLTAPGGAASVVGSYTATTATYAQLEESNDIKLGGVSVSAIDVTHLLSTAKEFIAGLKDNGSCDYTCNFINGTVQETMRQDCNNGVTSPYQIVIPNGATTITMSFSAFHTKFDGPEAKVDGKLEIMGSLKITGDITLTSA